MPLQAPQWTDFLSCPICNSNYDGNIHQPISLGCGHTVCKACLLKLQCLQCPYDQTQISREIEELPVNSALLQLVGASPPANEKIPLTGQDLQLYKTARRLIEQIALYLQPTGAIQLSRPMQRKLVTLINCQMIESDGRGRTMRSIRSLAERSATELILQHQNPQQLSANLWAAVRSRGCQFLGPAMQEEVLKLILLALEDGSALSRKVLVLFVVQRLEPHFPQASKTSIGHVVQLLYRASCFKVAKRDGDSSLMQLKDEFRTYEALRREHDAQIVQIATEAGLRIAPDQWSSLLYGDTIHKSHMQSIIDKLQTPQSFTQSIQELVIALQRTGDPHNLSHLRQPLELLANIDPSTDAPATDWRAIETSLQALKVILDGLVQFIQQNATHKLTESTHLMHAGKYKTSMCRDLQQVGGCPRGLNCTFAHSQDELEKNRSRSRKNNPSMKSSNAVSDKLPGGFNRQSADVKPPESVLSEKADVFKPKLSDVQPTPLPAVQPVPMIRALVPTPDHPEALLFPTPPVRGFLPMEGMVQQQQQQQQGQQGAPAVAGLHPGVAAAHALPGARQQPFYGGSPAPYQAVYGGDLQRSMYQAQPESMSYPMMESYTLKEVPAGHMMQHSHTAIPDSFQNAVAFQSEQIAHQQIKIAALHQRKKEILLELDQCQSQMVAQTTLPTPSSAVNSVSCASTHPQYTVSTRGAIYANTHKHRTSVRL
ncbi:PREDICTED: roquin-1-like [Priapulus caudatus]|uniref:RING-type E3 ubiquitin transferase n=1 Tax=Priapulus caudatus TaxID=37621 RepID=A0ABM1E2T0_PRICU|nr:PREDICTED: roquin-1-like [Priapulus caudatus]